MWNDKIPKVLHTYWGKNKRLSYLRYLTIKTFMIRNPEWQVIVHYPRTHSNKITWDTGEQSYGGTTGTDYFTMILSEINNRLEVREFKFQAEMGVSEDTPEVLKSDILRWYLLHKEGGVWSDLDIVYIAPMESMSIDDNDAYVCYNGKYFSIGFLMARPRNDFYRVMYNTARDILRSRRKLGYRIVGNKLFPDDAVLHCGNIDPRVVYPVAYNETKKLFHSGQERMDLDKSLGVHWFGGCSESSIMECNLAPNNMDKFTYCELGKLVEGMLCLK